MTHSTVSSILDANLAALGELNADLARSLQLTAPAAVEWSETPEGVPAARLDGRSLCSRHRPLEEADRLIADVDLVEHAVIAVLGFGAGYHVRRLAERLGKAGVVVILEPDLALLRAVFERIDMTAWLSRSLTVWITDPDNRAALARKMHNAEAIIAQGLHVLEHPPSAERLRDAAPRFTAALAELVTNARTTLLTTLVRSVDTVRNLLLNLDHYAGGSGIGDLANAAAGQLGIVVSAGPSLRRNMHLLAAPGVRERCVIIATQTTLRPLLEAGVRPHFVTALDYHEISKRFYEGLDAEDVSGVTLVADPKAHPVILDAFPGAVRCCASPVLDQVLGPLARPMGTLPPGATVAHLAYALGRHLGCDPIALVGQDLGFTDGLYYARGTAIDDVWAPELNPFNTMEMMEWQRIVRHRAVLRKTVDVHGRSIYTDQQMLAYLQQFEREFAADAERGRTTIDATEGGVAKAHTVVQPLREALDRYANEPVALPPPPSRTLDTRRLEQVKQRVERLLIEVEELRSAADESRAVLDQMVEHQRDSVRMSALFNRLDALRHRVEARGDAFTLLNQLNQLGAFKRFRADRRLHMLELSGLEDDFAVQRAQLERDRVNVEWIGDAAAELRSQLSDTLRVLAVAIADPKAPQPVEPPDPTLGTRLVESMESPASAGATGETGRATVDGDPIISGGTPRVERVQAPVRAAALVPIDPQHGGLGTQRSLDSEFGGKTVLQRTLERLGASRMLECIVLLAPDNWDESRLIDPSTIGVPVEVDRCGASVFGPEREAIIAARLWSDTSWRGGIGGMSIYDEVLAPRPMLRAMERRGLTAAVICGPDWPLVDVSPRTGVDALVARHARMPSKLPLVFTQAPPGLSACLVSIELMRELCTGNRLCTIGSLLVYQPHAPQHDPIARDANVQVDHALRRSLVRATFDTPRYKLRLRRSVEPLILDRDDSHGGNALPGGLLEPAACIASIEQQWIQLPTFTPPHLIIELCTGRFSSGAFSPHRYGSIQRPPMTLRLLERIVSQLGASRDTVITFDGVGDPLHHPDLVRAVALAKSAGVRGVHVRTELLHGCEMLPELVEAGVDVISVDLHADRAATYKAMMGVDRFRDVLTNLERLVSMRRRFSDLPGATGFCLPWIVPRLQRRVESYEDIETFYDRWMHLLGTALLEGPPPFDPQPHRPVDPLASARAPLRVMRREGLRRMTVLSDGRVPVSELDRRGEGDMVADLHTTAVLDAWRDLFSSRRRLVREVGEEAEALRTVGP